MFGVGIAMGFVTPSKEFWAAITDGEGEAILMKGLYEAGQAARASSHGE